MKVVRKVVDDLKTKGVVSDEIVRAVEEIVRRKESEKEDVEMKDAGAKEKERERERRHESDSSKNRHKMAKDTKSNGHGHGHRVDKRAIEQRIEEDRERNKRLRESVWAVEGDDEGYDDLLSAYESEESIRAR